MIELKNISKKYANNSILDDISIKLPQNKLISIIGSNGAGKSTLLSAITRTLLLDEGEVLLDGKSIYKWDKNELAKQISIQKQTNTLNVKLTVRELVSFARYPYSKSKLTEFDNKIIDEALEYIDIKHLENRFLDELSGGQRQMAYIAMVIAQDTKYIFLDEPLNNLDMKHSTMVMKILKRLVQEKNKTIMVVIHDINYVTSYSDYIISLKNGKVAYAGDVYEILKDEILSDIFDMKMSVVDIKDKKICFYY
ncbi:ATP-binding cassette domain-containing protein [Campylobacter sp. FMV-PI01]|uniref:ATP-binding cassette domain-containing protein n=1 Tax=Campylobacter portucalensis TaxID=2608384 RepID=A0A6L5WIG7_9BACT|nr:ATP-binding cassette domain-containing protein [Campylobacter portucalensis]MSN97078.1 ATP-binding cassette domain-containing protein [Campylobacter portucalensis]